MSTAAARRADYQRAYRQRQRDRRAAERQRRTAKQRRWRRRQAMGIAVYGVPIGRDQLNELINVGCWARTS